LICEFVYRRYGTFAYKVVVKLPWVDESEYALAIQDEREAEKKKSYGTGSSAVYNVLRTEDEEEVIF